MMTKPSYGCAQFPSFPLLHQCYLLQDGDESYKSSDVDHGDDGGESDDDGEKIVIINGSFKWCFFY